MEDMVIIGGGPAGLSAALYTLRGGQRTVVIGKDGGALWRAAGVENYFGAPGAPGGRELVETGRRQVAELARQVEPRMTVHDLRVIRGTTHTNLVFDAVLPLDAAITPAEAARRIREKVAELDGDYYAVVTVEHSFTE